MHMRQTYVDVGWYAMLLRRYYVREGQSVSDGVEDINMATILFNFSVIQGMVQSCSPLSSLLLYLAA